MWGGLWAEQGSIQPLQPVMSLDLLEGGAARWIFLEHPGDQTDEEKTERFIVSRKRLLALFFVSHLDDQPLQLN